MIVHRQYDAATFENDLAILELESPVRYDSHIGMLIEFSSKLFYIRSLASMQSYAMLHLSLASE